MKYIVGIMGIGVVATVLALALLEPWGGGGSPAPAVGAEQWWWFCGVNLQVPSDISVNPLTLPDGRTLIVLNSQKAQTAPSAITLDPQTGAVLVEKFNSPEDKARLTAVLQTIKGSSSPIVPAWPRTETHTNQPNPHGLGNLHFFSPEAGSGITYGVLSRSATEEYLTLQGCSFRLRIDTKTGKVSGDLTHISADDQAALHRWLAACEGCQS